MKKRTSKINIRVTEKEKMQIVLMAKLCKLSVSEFLRILALGGDPELHQPSDD